MLGPICAYRLLNPNWFEMPVDDFTGGDMLVGGGMLELNAILKPKHRHVIEVKKRCP